MWSNPQARAAVDCRETDRGDVRKEIVVGRYLWRKGGQPQKRGNAAPQKRGKHARGGDIIIASLLPHMSAFAAE